MRALIIRDPWIDKILAGRKTWEMRKSACHVRGRIGLIRKSSDHVVGTVDLVDCEPMLSTRKQYAAAERYHRIRAADQAEAFADGYLVPWVLANARPLARPVPYEHRTGAVIWVNLNSRVTKRVNSQVRG